MENNVHVRLFRNEDNFLILTASCYAGQPNVKPALSVSVSECLAFKSFQRLQKMSADSTMLAIVNHIDG